MPPLSPTHRPALASVLSLALGLLVLQLSLLAGLSAPEAAEAKTRDRGAPLYWGAQIGPQLTGEEAPWDMRATHKFARRAGKRPSLISFSAPFADCRKPPCSYYSFPTTPLDNVRDYGAIPLFGWSPEGRLNSAGAPAFRLARLIDGSYDSYIRYFAAEAASWGHPFLMRFAWEMNGNWFPWSEWVNRNRPGQYVAAWRHVHDIFRSAGATNVSWVWCPNIDPQRKLQPLKSLYPGDAYVDWTCLDGFNWGGIGGWRSFTQLYRSTYRRVEGVAPGKPMIVSEIASNEHGGSKATWTRNMLRVVPRRYPKIRALVWYNEADRGHPWPIESSSASRRAFMAGIRQNVYRPNEFGEIEASPIPPPSWPR